jgi:hypothetical protein
MIDPAGAQPVTEGATWGLGKVFLQPRQVADLAYRHGVTKAPDLATMIAICFAESQGGVDAWHDNLATDGATILSRDVGLWQRNIPASAIGTSQETDLYDPDTNASAMFALYKNRHFEPWASFTSGVYLHDVYTGKAALGLCNFAAEQSNKAGASLPLPLFSTADLRKKLPPAV